SHTLPRLFSFRSPDRGGGGAPRGGILCSVAPVTARRHVCEAWAIPRNRDGASRRSTVTLLGPLRARCRSYSPARRRGRPLLPGCSARSVKGPEPPGYGLRNRGRDATSRSAFRIVSGDAPR